MKWIKQYKKINHIFLMNDKSSVSKGFNRHFFDFLNDILNIYPENKDIKFAIRSFENIKKLNTTIIIKVWKKQVYDPYQKEIDEGNIDFFIEKDYKADLGDIGQAAEIVKIIENVKGPIRSMDAKNKEFCAKYIQNLSKLSKIYNTL
tara:strand:+ start:8163 stop:8603 length:441 start_codon:yes stop_codon:yes gene_type:complete